MSVKTELGTVLTEGREVGGMIPPAPVEGRNNLSSKALPEDAVIIVPVRNVVAFPGLVQPFSVGRPSSIAAVQEAVRSERPIGILLQRDPSVDRPGADD